MDVVLNFPFHWFTLLRCPQFGLKAKYLAQVIKLRLELEDCKHGVVFDGLKSAYAESPLAYYEGILLALGMQETLAVMPPPVEPEEPAEEPDAAGKKAPEKVKKGEEEEEPPAPPPPTVWGGPKKLVVVKLHLTREQVGPVGCA